MSSKAEGAQHILPGRGAFRFPAHGVGHACGAHLGGGGSPGDRRAPLLAAPGLGVPQRSGRRARVSSTAERGRPGRGARSAAVKASRPGEPVYRLRAPAVHGGVRRPCTTRAGTVRRPSSALWAPLASATAEVPAYGPPAEPDAHQPREHVGARAVSGAVTVVADDQPASATQGASRTGEGSARAHGSRSRCRQKPAQPASDRRRDEDERRTQPRGKPRADARAYAEDGKGVRGGDYQGWRSRAPTWRRGSRRGRCS